MKNIFALADELENKYGNLEDISRIPRGRRVKEAGVNASMYLANLAMLLDEEMTIENSIRNDVIELIKKVEHINIRIRNTFTAE